MTDIDLRKMVKHSTFNGEYATLICRNCKGFKTNPKGNTETCEIVDLCEICSKKIPANKEEI